MISSHGVVIFSSGFFGFGGLIFMKVQVMYANPVSAGIDIAYEAYLWFVTREILI
jgi:hypothetical protein